MPSLPINHIYQFQVQLPLPLQQTLCGIASIAHTLQYFKIKTPDIVDLVRDFIRFGNYNRPYIAVQFRNWPGNKVPVRFLDQQQDYDQQIIGVNDYLQGFYETEQQNQWELSIEYPQDGEYLPSFLLDRGSDSRGVRSFLRSYRLDAHLYEFKLHNQSTTADICYLESANTFREQFLHQIFNSPSQPCAVIASAVFDLLPYPTEVKKAMHSRHTELITHLVVVIPQKNNRPDSIVLIDSAMPSSQGIHTLPTETFLNALLPQSRTTGHFLVIHR